MRATTFTVQERRDDATPDHKRERGRGQALVEFAIVLPVFFLVVAGMFDFGLGIYSDLTLVNAAREGARLGVIDPGNTSAIENRVREMAGNLDASKLSVTVECERPSGSSFTGCTSPMWLPGDATKVTVGYKYSVFFPVLFGTEIPLSSESKMRIE
jgi:Flp pilus assembly protein TadG